MNDELTKRELQVLNLAKQGKIYKEIADLLGIDAQTVKIHASHIRRKLGKAPNIAGAVYRAMKSGIID
jgi:DNA-binding CsgD family transcriptional regulator